MNVDSASSERFPVFLISKKEATMKPLKMSAGIAAVLFLSACGGGQAVTITSEGANSRLHRAVQNCDDDGVHRWINKGANPNMRFSDGGSLLGIAASNVGRSGCAEIIGSLIRQGANANNVDDEGGTPLMSAAYNGWNYAVRQLLEAGADADVAKYDTGYTALMFAAQQGEHQTVNLLLQNGADASITNRNGNTALDIALRNQNTNVVLIFQRHGVSQ